MKKLFFLLLLGGAAWAGWELHTKGTEGAFGGALAPIESQNHADAPAARHLTPSAQMADEPMHMPRSRGPSGGSAAAERARKLRDRSR